MFKLDKDKCKRLYKVFNECFDFANLGMFMIILDETRPFEITLIEKYREEPHKEYISDDKKAEIFWECKSMTVHMLFARKLSLNTIHKIDEHIREAIEVIEKNKDLRK